MDPVSGALAGASLISGIAGGKSAKKAQNRAASGQAEVAKRAVQLFDTIFGGAAAADKAGFFNSDAQIKQLEKDTARYEAEDLGGLAGAAKVAGYAPGDTVVTKMLENVKGKYRSTLDNARLALRRSSLFDKLGAYAMAGQSGALGTAGSIYSQQYQQAANSQPRAGGFFANLMPFFAKPNGGGGGGGVVGDDIVNSNWMWAGGQRPVGAAG
jgi:hypothetical protein